MTIKSNTFTDNEDDVAFYDKHSLLRASQIYLDGTQDVNIEANTFIELKHIKETKEMLSKNLVYIEAWLPSGFF